MDGKNWDCSTLADTPWGAQSCCFEMDCLQAWPEPIIRVQSLSESGVTVIPDRYIKSPSERPSFDSGTGEEDPHLSIPVIDLRGLADGMADAQCHATVRAISEACREWGFFQVVHHGVSLELMERVREVWRGFFHLSMEEKQTYANSPKTYEGYGSRLGVDKGAILDWGDYYFLNFLPHSIKDHDKWPARPASCRGTIEEYGRESVKLCRVLMNAMSIGLGLDIGQLQESFGGDDDAGASMRANLYPKCPQPELALGLSPHSDPGGITLLLPDDRVNGLQVRKGDAWVYVHPAPHAMIVNVGDQIQVLSNATFKSVEHRVVVNPSEERLSVAFFYNPKDDLPVGPIQDLVTPDRPPFYQPMPYKEYKLFVRKRGLHGRSQVESLKAT